MGGRGVRPSPLLYPYYLNLAELAGGGYKRAEDLALCKDSFAGACVRAYLPLPTPTYRLPSTYPYLPRQEEGAGRKPYPLDYLPFPVTVATKAKTATAIKYPTSSGCVLNLSGDCGEGRSGLSVNDAISPAE